MGFFDWLGSTIGYIIRFIIDILSGALFGVGDAIKHFLQGMAQAIGINDSFISFILLAFGLFLLFHAFRRLLRGGIISGVIWLILSLVVVLGWLIH